MKTLDISETLSLPEEVITQKLAFLGITGSGKTYAAGKLAELLIDTGAQLVILDPVGVHWGLRLNREGTGQSRFHIPVLGGLKGDIPLSPDAGAIVADMLVSNSLSAVIDVSQFGSSDHYKFALAFATTLFQRRKEQPAAMHLIIDEAQEWIPQNATDKGNEPKMLRAFERLWKLGRNFGIGGSLLSQRPQEVNKKVLNMSSTIFAFNMLGKQERDAIRSWIQSKMSGAEGILDTLPSLKVGTCHVFSPQFLSVNKVCRIARKDSFDASATPVFKKDGPRTRWHEKLSPVDIHNLAAKMEASLIEVKGNDPIYLRGKIEILRQEKTALEKQLAQRPAVHPEIQIEKVEVPAIEPQLISDMTKIYEDMKAFGTQITEMNERIASTVRSLNEFKIPPINLRTIATSEHGKFPAVTLTGSKLGPPFLPPKSNILVGARDLTKLNAGHRRILIAVAQYPSGRSKRQIAILAQFSVNSGTFSTYLSYLTTSGYVVNDGTYKITQDGLVALGDYQPLPTGQALIDHWLQALNAGEGRIFTVLVQAYPRHVTKQEVASLAGFEPTSGTYGTYLSKLRTLEIVEGRTELRASETFFQ